MNQEELRQAVEQAVERAPVVDIHTHLYPPNFGGLCLWGIDELVTYHYLIAELFRSNRAISPEQFWTRSKQQQADTIWEALFVGNTPLSEAARGVVRVMTALGLDPHAAALADARKFFASQNLESHIDNVMRIAGVTGIVMTNDPFNPAEAAIWKRERPANPRFHAALRMDPLLNSAESLFSTVTEARNFVDEWIDRMQPLYMAASLPAEFAYPDETLRTKILREVVMPVGLKHNLPFAMMIGVVRQVNPRLRDAGDSSGRADVRAVERIAADFPENRFLVTMLSRENQHELCVVSRKFANIMPFGCWWFLNNPSIVAEITAERLEMLGSSFIPQHSDARILEQIIYKWAHSRRVIAAGLYEQYKQLSLDGWPLRQEQIERDIRRMFSGNFEEWIGKRLAAEARS